MEIPHFVRNDNSSSFKITKVLSSRPKREIPLKTQEGFTTKRIMVQTILRIMGYRHRRML